MRFSKAVSRRATSCVYCLEEIQTGEEYISVSGSPEETQGTSGYLHLPCFIRWIRRLPPKEPRKR